MEANKNATFCKTDKNSCNSIYGNINSYIVKISDYDYKSHAITY